MEVQGSVKIDPIEVNPGKSKRNSFINSKDSSKNGNPDHVAAQPFSFSELATATRNFRPESLLAEGLYKGHLESTNQVVAIKYQDGLQGDREFLIEVLMLSVLHHPNLVNLIGYCVDWDDRILIYEYMPLGSLEDHLHDVAPGEKRLDWNTRMKIAAGVAKGLEYLHEKANPPVIHRDLKCSNVLLGEGYHPKLSHFGFAKIGPVRENTRVFSKVTGVMDTIGYCDPEYARTGQLTWKSDVYSFGVVLLEIITGRKAIDNSKSKGGFNLVSWARPFLMDRRKFSQMADPMLQGQYPPRGLSQAIAVAAMCVQEQANMRPGIADVAATLSYLASERYDPNTHTVQSLHLALRTPPCFGNSNTKGLEKMEVPESIKVDSVEANPGKSRRNSFINSKDSSKNGNSDHIASQPFSFHELATATRNFTAESLWDEGVFKGHLESINQIVAIKHQDGLQGDREFLIEVLMLCLLHHPNLVNLIGYCVDGDHRLLIYEYMPLGSLEDLLDDVASGKKQLDWKTRMKIAAGVAKGLEYLHDKANPRVIHRDLKCSNILLGEGYHPKLSGFGLAKIAPVEENTCVFTRVTTVLGTIGYCDPEYAMTGQLTRKSDIYSFGVILLEIITGRKAIEYSKSTGVLNLVSWARPLFRDRRNYSQMADPMLQGQYPQKGLYRAIAVAAMCVQNQANKRPEIADLVMGLNYLASTKYDPNKHSS